MVIIIISSCTINNVGLGIERNFIRNVRDLCNFMWVSQIKVHGSLKQNALISVAACGRWVVDQTSMITFMGGIPNSLEGVE